MSGTERLNAALAGRYKIEKQLGQGGMATVYLAEDMKHKRRVAIKVLKPELAAVLGAERFVQEITTTAALSHPHILPLFDSGETGGFLYYVMPYIEGETIREKLNRERQCGIEEAVKIATEVADALDYAHRHGVIHRDIKPENILLHDGRPMVMDFGIALAVSAAAGGRMTETGLSLGTPHYMSPEQATADRDITGRSDVYSLASVLYEMLTGEPPHMGTSAQQIIMKIIAEPVRPATDLRKSVPPNVAAALHKALEKLPADRFETAGAFTAALRDPGFRTTAIAADERAVFAAAGQRSPLVWGLGIATLSLAVALAWALSARPAPAPAVSLHAFLSDTAINVRGGGGVTISPDGESVIVGSGRNLFLRAVGDPEFRKLDVDVGATGTRVSPDGNFLVFLEQRGSGTAPTLRRMPLRGGQPVTLADSVVFADWCDNGSLIVRRGAGILRLGEDGKALERLAQLDTVPITNPSVLPDCQGLLLTDAGGGNGRLLLLDFRSGAVTQLHEQGDAPRYVTSGHILFKSQRPEPALMALPFDVRRRRVTGPPTMVVPRIANWDLSRNGTLVYLEAPGAQGGERLVWVDLSGKSTPLPIDLSDFETPRLSPDGRRIAFLDFNQRTLLLYEISTGATTKLLGPNPNMVWAWAADGRSLYVSTEVAVLRVRTDGSGVVDTAYRGAARVFAASADRARLIIGVEAPSRGWDIAIVRLDGATPAVEPYLRANWNERQPALSPDGRWLAYVSDESGRSEVYVRAFPVPGDAVRISDDGGTGPNWAPRGAAIFYEGPQAIMRAQVVARATGLTVRSRARLFSHEGREVTTLEAFQRSNLARRWDVANGGDRLLMVRSDEELFLFGQRLRVITNFFDEIRRRTATR